MSANNFSPEEEREARRLLGSGKQADQNALLDWLGMMPAATSLDMLAKIAANVPKRRSMLGVATAILIVTLLLWIISIAMKKTMTIQPLPILSLFFVLEVNLRNNEHISRKAALLLSYRDDYRAVAPLAKLWRLHTPRTVAALKENEVLEHALTRLLTVLTDKGRTDNAEEAVRDLLGRAFPPLTRSDKGMSEEISESRADLMLAALRYLAPTTAGKETSEVRELIARIASYPLRSFTPNRSLVYETAQAYVGSGYPTRSWNAAEPVAKTLRIRL